MHPESMIKSSWEKAAGLLEKYLTARNAWDADRTNIEKINDYAAIREEIVTRLKSTFDLEEAHKEKEGK